MQREIAVVVAAEPGACCSRIQLVVGIVLSVERNAYLKRCVSGLDARAHLIISAAVCSSIEVAGGAGGHAVAACLHIPEKRLAQSYGCILISDVVAEARNFRNRYRTERRQRAQRNNLGCGRAALRTDESKVSRCCQNYGDPGDNPKRPEDTGGRRSHLLSPSTGATERN